MDEAERCHRLAYIAYGNLLARGSVEEVVQTAGADDLGSHRTGFAGSGGKNPWPARRGTDRRLWRHAARERARRGKIARKPGPWMTGAYHWEQIESGLEDVFISLMETAKDNFS